MTQSIKAAISGLVSIAAAAAIVTVGYSVGKDQGQAIIDLIKIERDSLKADLLKLSRENESLKVQLLTSQSKPAKTLEVTLKGSKGNVEALVEPGVGLEPQETSNAPLSEELFLSTQKTGLLFNGAIQITLIATHYTGSPLRHQVLANVLIPGEAPFEIRNADPGSAFTVGRFQVLISESGTYSASFKVFEIKGFKKLRN